MKNVVKAYVVGSALVFFAEGVFLFLNDVKLFAAICVVFFCIGLASFAYIFED